MSDNAYRFRPINRTEPLLRPSEIRIAHGGGEIVTTPPGLSLYALGKTGALRLADLTPLDGIASMLSGSPAIIYRDEDFSLLLTPDEVDRLARHDLTAAEYLTIREHVGMAFIIAEHLYNAETGEALDPISDEPSMAPGI